MVAYSPIPEMLRRIKAKPYLHARFLHKVKHHVDIEINFKIEDKHKDKYKKMTFRMDRIDLDRFVIDLQMEQHILDGKTLEQATELTEGSI